jgi:hypothetical protein
MDLVLVPQPPRPGLYITTGPENLVPWALESITRTFAYPARIVWVDAANAFNAYLVGMAARASYKDPNLTLQSYQVARPFTPYQLETMVSEKTLPAMRRVGALFSVIADPLRLFKDAEGRDTQLRQCYRRFLAGLENLARQVPVLALDTGRDSFYRQTFLKVATHLTELTSQGGRPTLRLTRASPPSPSQERDLSRLLPLPSGRGLG